MVAVGRTSLSESELEPVGSLSMALGHARRLLETQPALAEQQAEEILKVLPDQADALLILGVAKQRNGDAVGAKPALMRAITLQPRSPAVYFELGLTHAHLGETEEAIRALTHATEIEPTLSDAWRTLGDLHTARGDIAAADAAYGRQIIHSVNNPVLMEAASALTDNRLAVAERLLKDFLKRFPTDVAAIRMLAEVAARIGRFADAETLLRRCVELAPGFAAARHNYALALLRQGKSAAALTQVDHLLQTQPHDPGYRNLKAAALSHLGDYDRTIELYAEVLRDHPRQPKVWMSYGHALKTAGRLADGIAAYRRGIAEAPNLGEAYWSLANLKTFRFTEAEIAAMQAQLARDDLSKEDRLHFHFALGRAFEDDGSYAESFAHYAEGNGIRNSQLGYDADETSDRVDRAAALFTRDLLESHAGSGCVAPDPIFIVGLPRSGSTLIEQILSSHSAVEGTMELPDLPAMAQTLADKRNRGDDSKYPEILATFPPERLAELGREYLDRTRAQRKTGRPFFIDKTPHNFFHVGMIQLILPNAKIIDARRHPTGACFSGFKQHFARGQAFSYGLESIGRYYRDYARLMGHFDAVMPGRVHRVIYERMVDDTEAEIRRLLDYCVLPFEPSCLSFHENNRAVRTPSSEQVRRPIFREGIDHWRHYEPWLEPLKAVLGDVLSFYPEAPP